MTLPTVVRGSLLLVVTLMSGFALGVSYERYHPESHESIGTGGHDIMHRFTQELDLDSAQEAAIAEILTRRQREVESSWHSVKPHVRATVDSTMQEIAGVLRPDQREKYRKLMEAAHPAGHR